MSDSLWDAKAAADYLGISIYTVYRYTEQNQLPHIKKKFGLRFIKDDLDTWLEKDKRKENYYASLNQDKLTSLPITLISNMGGICELAKSKSKTRYNFGYGAIYQRKTKNGKVRWYLDYYDADRRRIQKVAKNAPTREEASLALREEVAKAFDREYTVKRKTENIKFKDFVEMFIENYSRVNKRSWKDDFYRLQRCISFFGNVYLHEVTALEIEMLKSAKIEEGLTKTTVNHYLKILKRLYNIGIEWGYIRENPVRRIKFYNEKDCIKERILTEKEEERLLDAASEHLRPILILALNTGMRRGEILNLSRNRIDLEKRFIQVVNTKAGRNRVIPINDSLFKILSVIEKKSEFLFYNLETGKPYRTVRRSFDTACRKAEIEGLRFHDLRHTFASRLVERGVDIVRVKELLGHSSVKITERYTHSNQEERKKAVELLCRKSVKVAKKVGNLLRNCDIKKERNESVFTSSLFSVN